MVYTLLVVLICLVALLMIFIVLIQESKGGGLSSNFSSSNQIMGVKKTTDVVEKATWGLAIAMVIISVLCAYTSPKAAGEESVAGSATTEQTATPAMPGANTDAATKQAAPAQDAAKQGATAPAAKTTTPAEQAAPAAGNAAAPAPKN